MKTIPTMVLLGLWLTFGAAAPSAATWQVAPPPVGSDANPGTEQQPFATIQKGLDTASHGDTVVVAPGTYRENVQFKGKNIILRSTDPPNAAVRGATVIDAGRSGPAVAFAGTEDETCALAGFTLRNGAGTGGHGGGIRGGAWDLHTHAAIQFNHVTDNDGDSGGGLVFCDGLIQYNVIQGNWADHGGGLYQCNGALRNNVIAGNSAWIGGGLWECNGLIANNVVYGNSADCEAGGLGVCKGAIANCIIWGNRSRLGWALYESSVPAYSCIENWAGGGTGNIFAYPYFADADKGDFHLRSWSPCINAGDPAALFANEPEPNGGRIDMGAYGNTAEATAKSADADGDGLPDDWETFWFGESSETGTTDPDGDLIVNSVEYRFGGNPLSAAGKRVVNVTRGTAYFSIQTALTDAASGEELVVYPGVYEEHIWFEGKNVVLRSTDPSDTNVVAQTVIDGGSAGPVVTFAGTETEECVLAGFTITRGAGSAGGGIVGHGTHATIEHNNISDNYSYPDGGGLYDCDGPIRHNVIANNYGPEDGAGGGLYGCDGPIEHNVISGNEMYEGGGLYECQGPIRYNTIVGNSGVYGGGGLEGCYGVIANNVIAGNVGAGLADCNGIIMNNTIAFNSSGLYRCDATILNCIVWGNAQRPGDQLLESRAPTYSCIQYWTGGGEGNFAFAPYFVDESKQDFHLRSWSPCIDAGDPAWPFADEPAPNGGRVDLGAYGNTAEATSRSLDTDDDELPDDWERFWFSDLSSGPSDDLDGDFFWNQLEYQIGRNPTSAAEQSVRNLTKRTGHFTIQSALSAAENGDELVVEPGVYQETIRFEGKNVVLRSAVPGDPAIVAQTFIHGGERGPVVTFAGTEDETCLLWGFTISYGWGCTNGGGVLGGTADLRTRATIVGNVIANNSVSDFGGGLAFCGGLIASNRICDNYAGKGGGLYGCGGRIHGNVITSNYAYFGAGLYGCDSVIEGNVISANRTWEGNGGGLDQCEGAVLHNVIANNSAQDGGGLNGCTGTIENNTIYGNSAIGNGGGLCGCPGPILNSIIWGNSAKSGAALYQSGAPTYCCIQDWTGGGAGNHPYHPYFVDAAKSDYHLRSWSPCVDAGDPASLFTYEPSPNGLRIDQGAYGNTAEATPKSADSDGDGLPDEWELFWFLSLVFDGTDDPDVDFIPNAVEYLRDRNPTSPAENHVINISKNRGYLTIGEALASASDGDEIVVAQGLYAENVRFEGRNVVLRGAAPDNTNIVATTIIEGDGSGPVVSFAGTESEVCALTGLTIRKGVADQGAGICGGDATNRTRATISYNVVTDCAATMAGGGLAFCGGVAFCDGLIAHNTIVQNTGAGLFECDGTIRRNRVAQQRDLRRWDHSGCGLVKCDGLIEANIVTGNAGGGLWDCQGRVEGNTITANKGYQGGGLRECGGQIANNIITGNSADVGGGLANCHGTVQNNLVAANSAESGGGLWRCLGTIQNNTITANTANRVGGGVEGWRILLRNCIVWGNTAPTEAQLSGDVVPAYCCIEGWTGGGQQNLGEDPQFIAPAQRNYRLQSGSPCIDGGVNYYWFAWPQRDLDGNCRLAGARVDIGCYECGATADTDGDLLTDADEAAAGTKPDNADTDSDGLRDGLEILRGSQPLVPDSPRIVRVPSEVESIQAALSLAATGDEIVVAPGLYVGNLQFCGAEVTLRSGEPANPATVAATILDGAGAGPAVSFAGGESAACVLAGFTVQNGVAYYAGGIHGNGTRATIRQNLIAHNASSYGGGLYACHGLILDNTVSANSAIDAGGGLSRCDGTIRGNLIAGNSAGEDGGGLSNCHGLIEHNQILANVGGEGCGGLHHCDGVIRNNAIVGNRADDSGGGGLGWCNGLIQNNLILRNSAHYGGGLNGCYGFIQNNTIVGNWPGGLYWCTNVIVNCVIWGNYGWDGQELSDCSPPTYCCIRNWTGGGLGNISADPQFVDAAKDDYRLRPSSPGIDAGDNTAWGLSATDFLGRPRVLFGGRSLKVDMGAYEFIRTACTAGPGPGQATVTWGSLAGKTYSLFYSHDLRQWQLADDRLPSAGNLTSAWTDDGAQTGAPPGAVPCRFYRCVENP